MPLSVGEKLGLYEILAPTGVAPPKGLERGPMKLADAMFAAILMNLLSSPASAAATCESLTSFSLPETTIALAQTVAPGEFAWPHAFVGRKGCLFQPCRFQTSREIPPPERHRQPTDPPFRRFHEYPRSVAESMMRHLAGRFTRVPTA